MEYLCIQGVCNIVMYVTKLVTYGNKAAILDFFNI